MARARDCDRKLAEDVGMSRDQIAQLVHTVSDIADTLRHAERPLKKHLYAELGVRLDHPTHNAKCWSGSLPASTCVVKGWCPRGDLNPHAR